MGKRVDDAESQAVLLRTSADIASHCLTQMDCLAREWPEFRDDSVVYRTFVEKLVSRAKEHGYVEKRGRV